MKTEMKCDDARSQLPLHVGGDLEAPLAESLRGHLNQCESCSLRLEALERSRDALISTRRTELSDGSPIDLWAGIRSQLASEGLLDRGTRPQRLPVSSPATSDGFRHGVQRRPRRALGGLAAAAALMLLVWSPWSDRSAPEQVAATPAGASAPTGQTGQTGQMGEQVASQSPGAGLAPEVLLISNEPEGALRRAEPGEERLADSARPFPGLLPFGGERAGRTGEVLVGDERQR